MNEFKMNDFKVIKRWNASDIRGLCIEKEYYTCGDCEAYAKMLCFVCNNEPTKENIFKVAVDILEHSDIEKMANTYGCSKKELLSSILFEIERKVYTYWQTKED